MTKPPAERTPQSGAGFVWPDEQEMSAVYADLRRRWNAGEINLPTFGNDGYRRNYFRQRALSVAADLIARGLSGEAAVDYLRRTERRLLGFYEGKAALVLVDTLSSLK
jgi:hypothetical protein